MRILRNQEIEEIAQSRLAELERLLGQQLSPPIPIDLIAEKVLGLDFLWEPIDELPGEQILGGLIAKKRLIILNENRKALFAEKPGVERSTKGHEMGHWDLFIDKSSLDHPTLFDVEGEGPFVFRSSPAGEVAVGRLDRRGERLHGVGQGVRAGRRGEPGRAALGEFGVADRHRRDQEAAGHPDLGGTFRMAEDRDRGHLGAGAGGGRHGDHRDHRSGDAGLAVVVRRLSPMRDQCRNHFSEVKAAAKIGRAHV